MMEILLSPIRFLCDLGVVWISLLTVVSFIPKPVLLGLTLVSAGSGYALAELVRNNLWLVPVLMGLSIICLHGAIAFKRKGLLAFLPPSLEDPVVEAMAEPVAHLIHKKAAWIIYHGCKWARLIVLCSVELDARQRAEIMSELDREFRHQAFQESLLAMLPEALQLVLLGDGRRHLGLHPAILKSGHEGTGLASQGTANGAQTSYTSPNGSPAQAPAASPIPPRRAAKERDEPGWETASVQSMMSALRSFEQAVEPILQDPEHPAAKLRSSNSNSFGPGGALQRVLNEKMSDATLQAMLQGGLHQAHAAAPGLYGRACELAGALKRTYDSDRNPLYKMYLATWVTALTFFRVVAPRPLQEQLLSQLLSDFQPPTALGIGPTSQAKALNAASSPAPSATSSSPEKEQGKHTAAAAAAAAATAAPATAGQQSPTSSSEDIKEALMPDASARDNLRQRKS